MLHGLASYLMGVLGPPLSSSSGLIVVGVLLGAAGLAAQEAAVVHSSAEFRAMPEGPVLGEIFQGTPLAAHESEGDWTRVTLRGYVWTASLELLVEEELDLTVSEEDGENLREEPAGRVAARLLRGAQLEEMERIPGWIQVRRTGWVPTASLEEQDAPDTASGVPEGFTIYHGPEGDTLAWAGPDADLRVLERGEGWARVRIEGWVRLSELDGLGVAEEAPPGEGALTGLSPRDLSEDPARYRGELVELRLEFISLERAEAIRTDFYEGEPFLLARSLGEERSFVYLSMSTEELGWAEGLAPLDRIRVVGRVRVAAAALTGSPILKLVELERLQ